jgi:hypothetical protein
LLPVRFVVVGTAEAAACAHIFKMLLLDNGVDAAINFIPKELPLFRKWEWLRYSCRIDS